MEGTTVTVVICWRTRDKNLIQKIRERFGINGTMSINRETRCRIKHEDYGTLKAVAAKGYIDIRIK